MIDIHCHILPNLDDGSKSLKTSIAMAKIAIKDGIKTIVCTPHIYFGVYNNNTKIIRSAVDHFRQALLKEGLPLELSYGADTHVHPDLVGLLKDKTIPTINGGRYFLLEPSHKQFHPFLEKHVLELIHAGYVPIITHPERLFYIEDAYNMFSRLISHGAWMQITAGSFTGLFGKRARYWAERFLDEGKVHVIASDAHSVKHRPPMFVDALNEVTKRIKEEEAMKMVYDRPLATLMNTKPSKVHPVDFIGDRNPLILFLKRNFIHWKNYHG